MAFEHYLDKECLHCTTLFRFPPQNTLIHQTLEGDWCKIEIFSVYLRRTFVNMVPRVSRQSSCHPLMNNCQSTWH